MNFDLVLKLIISFTMVLGIWNSVYLFSNAKKYRELLHYLVVVDSIFVVALLFYVLWIK